jgi:segregation and condensation protein B
MNYKSILESLLFVVGDEGLSIDDIKNVLELDIEECNKVISDLSNDYINRGIELCQLGNRYKLVTKKENKEYIQKLVTLSDSDTLSSSALETLAIIAYNQPVTRVMVDEIRGISSSHMIRKLVYKNLICEVGRSETAGRPILYGTTPLFLDYFGLNDIKELPQIEIKENNEEKELYNSKYKEEI